MIQTTGLAFFASSKLKWLLVLCCIIVTLVVAIPPAHCQSFDNNAAKENADSCCVDSPMDAVHFPSAPASSGSFSSFAGLSVYFGVGTAMDISNGQAVDTFGNGTLYNTPKMAGAFESIGGDWMLWPHWGIGFRTSFRTKSDYAGLRYRPLFYDFNTIYEPLGTSRRLVPEFEAGLGDVNLRFYKPPNCDSFGGCSNSNSYIESSNHFQVRLSAGFRGYVRGGLFLRPQVDIHWIHNLFQFGRDWVPEYSLAIGYTFGRNP
jgi:hypothetical protein